MIEPRLRKRDGRRIYEVRLRDPSGKEYSRTFDTKREAEAYEVAERAARNTGAWVDPRRASVRLATVAQDWLTSDPTKRGGSLARDRSILERHVLPTLGAKHVGAVNRADVQKLVKVWVGQFAPSTVARMYSCLRAVFSYAEDSELIVRSPCRNIRIPQAHPREAQILESDELQRLAAALGPDGPMVYLAALGLRWGEVAGLRVGRLDFLRHTITVAAQRTRGESGRMVDQDPKTETSRRTFAAPEWIMTMLADHLATRGLSGIDRDALVFVSPEATPLHYSNWRRRVWLPAVDAAGLRGLPFHDLRHTAATALIAQQVDIKTAQSRLGHSAQVMLRIYAQTSERADRAAADKVGDLFRPRDGRGTVGRNQPVQRPSTGA